MYPVFVGGTGLNQTLNINNNTSKYVRYVPNTGTLTSVNFTSTSDYRIKENILSLDSTFNIDNIKTSYIHK